MEKEENGSTTPSPCPPVPAKKRGGTMSLIRAAMLAMRGTSSPKKATTVTNAAAAIVDATADTVIKTIVGGMRPLHHRLDYESSTPPPPPPPPSFALDSYYDVHLPPPSPCSSEGMSRYASAEDLPALDVEDEAGGNGEPNAIDMRAEEFIAMFYKQMSLQRSESLKMIDEEGANVEEGA